jgi:hypothetical protein
VVDQGGDQSRQYSVPYGQTVPWTGQTAAPPTGRAPLVRVGGPAPSPTSDLLKSEER